MGRCSWCSHSYKCSAPHAWRVEGWAWPFAWSEKDWWPKCTLQEHAFGKRPLSPYVILLTFSTGPCGLYYLCCGYMEWSTAFSSRMVGQWQTEKQKMRQFCFPPGMNSKIQAVIVLIFFQLIWVCITLIIYNRKKCCNYT